MNTLARLSFGLCLIWFGNLPQSQAAGGLPQANLVIEPYQVVEEQTITLRADDSRGSDGRGYNLQYRFKINRDTDWTDWSTSSSYEFSAEVIGTFKARLEVKDAWGYVQTTYRSYRVVPISERRVRVSLLTDPAFVGQLVEWKVEAVLDDQFPLDEVRTRWDFDSDGEWDQDFSAEKIITHVYPLEFAGRKITPTIEVQWPNEDTEIIAGYYDYVYSPLYPEDEDDDSTRTKKLFIPNYSAEVFLQRATLFAPILDILPSGKTHNTQTIFTFDASASSLGKHAWLEWSLNGVPQPQWYGQPIVQHRFGTPGEQVVSVEACYRQRSPICQRTTATVKIEFSAEDFSVRLTSRNYSRSNSLENSFEDGLLTATVGDQLRFSAQIIAAGQIVSNDFRYRWDFDGNGDWDTPFLDQNYAEYRYTRNGKFQPRVQVQNNSSLQTEPIRKIATRWLTVENPTSPKGSLWFQFGGQRIKNWSYPLPSQTRILIGLELENSSAEIRDLQARFDIEGDGNWDSDFIGNPQLWWRFERAGDYVLTAQIKDLSGTSTILRQPIRVEPLAEWKKAAQNQFSAEKMISITQEPPELHAYQDQIPDPVTPPVRWALSSGAVSNEYPTLEESQLSPIFPSTFRVPATPMIKVKVSHQARYAGQVFRFDARSTGNGWSDWRWYIPEYTVPTNFRQPITTPLQEELTWTFSGDSPQLIFADEIKETDQVLHRSFRLPGEKMITVSAVDPNGTRRYFTFSVWVLGAE